MQKIKIQKLPLGNSGKTVKLSEIPVFGKKQPLFDGAAVKGLVVYIAEKVFVSGLVF